MYYTYTNNLPTQDPVENARLYVKLPRSILLPPYLAINPYYVEFTDTIDKVFDAPIEAKIQALRDLRNVWATSKTTENQIALNEMIPLNYWGGPDRATVIRQVNLLGMRLSEAGLLGENAYRTVARFVGQYWFEKGKGSMIDFINFCANTKFSIVNLWTEDYINFTEEGSTAIGTKIMDGGTWYPTTHVRLHLEGDSSQVDIQSIGNFFYEVANYNLVLESISKVTDLLIVNCTLTLPRTPNLVAKIVSVGLSSVCHYEITESRLPA